MLCNTAQYTKVYETEIQMAVGFLFLVLHKESETFLKSFLFGLLGISGRSSRYWSREHKMLCNTAQYTKVYEIGPSSRVVREAALGRRGWVSDTSVLVCGSGTSMSVCAAKPRRNTSNREWAQTVKGGGGGAAVQSTEQTPFTPRERQVAERPLVALGVERARAS